MPSIYSPITNYTSIQEFDYQITNFSFSFELYYHLLEGIQAKICDLEIQEEYKIKKFIYSQTFWDNHSLYIFPFLRSKI